MFTSLTGFWRQAVLLSAALIALWGAGIGLERLMRPPNQAPETPHEHKPSVVGSEPISPIPLASAGDPRKVALGQRLFHDVRLSADGTVSCASCHNLQAGGVDRLVRSRGIGGLEGGINAPTVFNSSLNFRQFWDGRAATLEDQVDGPLQHPLEMGSTWAQALKVIGGDVAYQTEFKALYAGRMDVASVKDAVATFERSLLTPNAPFDRYLRGDATALSPTQIDGYRLFKLIGCASCHQGVNAGGNMYQKLGIMDDYFASRGNLGPADLGRFNITGREEDRFHFRVPPLRNVAVTPPYMHDGSAATLDDAIRIMARYQLAKELDSQEVVHIREFLHSLTGEYQGQPLQ